MRYVQKLSPFGESLPSDVLTLFYWQFTTTLAIPFLFAPVAATEGLRAMNIDFLDTPSAVGHWYVALC